MGFPNRRSARRRNPEPGRTIASDKTLRRQGLELETAYFSCSSGSWTCQPDLLDAKKAKSTSKEGGPDDDRFLVRIARRAAALCRVQLRSRRRRPTSARERQESGRRP